MDWTTDALLLDQLRDVSAETAWERFYEQYGDAVFRYARKLGLHDADAQEVVQETMVTLMRVLPDFVYDRRRRFRNFLLTIAHRIAHDLHRERKRRTRLHALWSAQIQAERPAAGLPEEVRNVPGEEADLLRWREALLESAFFDLRRHSRTDRQSYDVFAAHAVNGESAEAVAARFGMTTANVYQIKTRMLERLTVMVRKLERDLEPAAMERGADE